jgi:hypothetical protein
VPIRPRTARIAAAASLVLATIAAGALPAHAADAAPRTVGPPGQPYQLNLLTDPASTDYDHRRVNLTGVLTRADGTPVVNGGVVVSEAIIFTTWNPWGDPIDPIYSEARTLDTVRTDQNGQFALPDTLADHVGNSSLSQVQPVVEFDAEYDPDGDPATYNSVFDSIQRPAVPVQSTLTYKVDKTRVHTGDTLTVSGTVGRPAGHGSVAGTPVFLRAFSESLSDARTTADAAGRFSFRYTVRGEDADFHVFSAPTDFYVAGASADLPVHHPVPLTYTALSATVDNNGLATVKAQLNPGCGSGRPVTLGLQFAKEGSAVWRTVGAATSDVNGAVRSGYRGGNGSYRWVHAETDTCAGGTSAARAVHRTLTRIAGFHGTPQPARKGARLRLNGTLQYFDGRTWKVRGRHAVEIWYRPTSWSAWTRKYVVQSSDRGAFQKTFTATARGWWKAVQVGDGGMYTSVSPADWIEVR